MGNAIQNLCCNKEEKEEPMTGVKSPDGPWVQDPKEPTTKPNDPNNKGKMESQKFNMNSTNSKPPMSMNTKIQKQMKLDEFETIRLLGHGTFGKVYLVQFRDPSRRSKDPKKAIMAMKIVKKKELQEISNIEKAMAEKNILKDAKHPFIIKLRYSFQDDIALYYLMEYAPGGELFKLLVREKRFSEEMTAFYAAEVFLCIKHLHKEMNTMYRDLKPENILLDESGHVKLTDFGLSKMGEESSIQKLRAKSFCGTPHYLAPEILKREKYDRMVDFWTLGCLIYEMLHGVPPFTVQIKTARDQDKLYHKIMEGKYTCDPRLSPAATKIIDDLLQLNPKKRIGYESHYKIEQHEFFKGIDWQKLFNKEVKPPYKPRTMQIKGNEQGFTINPTPQQNDLGDVKGFTYVPQNGVLAADNNLQFNPSLAHKGF